MKFNKQSIFAPLSTFAIACALGALSIASPAFAQDQDKAEGEVAADATPRIVNGTRFGSWAVSCEAIAVNETSCVLTQRFFRDTDRAFLGQLLAFWSADGKKSYIIARAPSGVHLPTKFVMKDESARKGVDFEWQSCARDLCEALAEVSLKELRKIEKAENVIAGYRISISGADFSFPIKPQGAAEGLEALKEMQENSAQ